MKKRKVGVFVESFKLSVRDGIRKAAELGADGFQVFCTWGEMAPESMTRTARQDFNAFVKRQGLVLSALCADYGHGFLDPSKNDEIVAKSKRCVDLAVDLDTKIITTHIGEIPEDEKNPAWKIGVAALSDLSDYAASKDILFACETGPEAPAVMKKFLDKIKTGAIRVNYDPANLAMRGYDHLGGVEVLKKYIVHTHAKDGVRVDGRGAELPLGEGAVDFPKYLAKLDAIGFDGFLTIEREVGENPAADIEMAIRFLRGM